MKNNIIILTGEKQSGKTTYLYNFCLNNKCAGILSPIVYSKRMFFDIEKQHYFDMEASGNASYLEVGKYKFSIEAFKIASTILNNMDKASNIKYFVVDEVGPLEINNQEGLYSSIKTILKKKFSFTLIMVIRESLIEEAISLFKLSNPIIMHLNEFKKQVY
jgi:nucleoside-triphosphatase THEP1